MRMEGSIEQHQDRELEKRLGKGASAELQRRIDKGKRILYLTLTKHWFDLIASGDKTNEYREQKPYWEKRLLEKDGTPKVFDIVRFRNGYSKGCPTMDVEFKGITLFNGERRVEEHGYLLYPKTIVIELGKVLSIFR